MNVLPDNFLVGPIKTLKQFKFICKIFRGPHFHGNRDDQMIRSYIREATNKRVVIEITYNPTNIMLGLLNYKMVGYCTLSYYRYGLRRTQNSSLISVSQIYKIYSNRNLQLSMSIIKWLEEIRA